MESSITPRSEMQTEAPVGAPVSAVSDVLTTLNQALKSMLFYGAENPSTVRALSGLRAGFKKIWEHVDELELFVHEGTLVYGNEVVYRHDNRNESLAFVFFKDGIRELVFFPGFETEELEQFLEVVSSVRSIRNETDDMVTLLWQRDLSFVRYGYIDVAAEETPLPTFTSDQPGDFTRALVLELGGRAAEETTSAEDGVQTSESPEGSTQVPENPQAPAQRSSGPVLGAEEMRYLEEELEKELARDVCAEVASALLDSLEAPAPATQSEVIEILGGLVPSLVEQGRVQLAGSLLSELRQIEASSGILAQEQHNELSHTLATIGSSEAVRSYFHELSAGKVFPEAVDLEEFFLHLGPTALDAMVRAAERTKRKEIQSVIRDAVWLLLLRHPSSAIDLLRSEDVSVVRGMVRMVPKLGRKEIVSETTLLLEHKDPAIRLSAIEALMAVGDKAALRKLVSTLRDGERSVRIAAAWALGTWQHTPALPQLEQILEDRAIREAHITEKVAFFEAYARIGKDEALPLLDRLLNKRKKLLGKREPSEIRACAARAIALVRSPWAQEILQLARDDKDAIVKRAVQRGLRRGR